MLKMALISYVTNSVKAIWSAVSHPLAIKGKKNGNLIGYRMYGNSKQSGTPTPSSPKEISSVGIYDEESGKYRIPINVYGKNLINLNEIPANSTTAQRYGANGLKAINVGKVEVVRLSLNIPRNTRFRVSWDVKEFGGGVNMGYYSFIDSNGIYYSATFDEDGKAFFSTVDVDIKAIEFRINTSSDIGSYYIIDNISVSIPNYQTELLLDEPLRKVGEFNDEIDFEKGQVIRRVYQEKLTTVDAKSSTSSTYYSYLTDLAKRPLVADKVAHCLATKFKPGNYAYSQIPRYEYVIKTYRTTAGVDRVAYSLASDNITDAQAEIGDGFEVCYVLYTPITESIELPPLPQFNGTTTYEVLTDAPPSGIQVCYYG